MQLSPPTTPDFGVNSPEEDGTNQMRGQGLGLGRISGTTSELPGIRVTTKGPEAILIRQNADYEILVENRGQIDAEGVLIRALVLGMGRSQRSSCQSWGDRDPQRGFS